MEIRNAKNSDLENIQEFNHEMSKNEAEKYDPTINPEFPLKQEGEKYFRERIKNDFAVIAEKDNEPVGYAVGAINPPEFYRTTGKVAEMENMFVAKNFRGRGIGSKLMEKFRSWAREKHADRLRVEASAENAGALKFYRKNDFEDYSITLEENL